MHLCKFVLSQQSFLIENMNVLNKYMYLQVHEVQAYKLNFAYSFLNFYFQIFLGQIL